MFEVVRASKLIETSFIDVPALVVSGVLPWTLLRSFVSEERPVRLHSYLVSEAPDF
jgi:hypothetical protein